MTRGLANDRSRMLYRGLIDMHQGVHRVKGEQDARFLVMSKEAKVDAIPSLDIASNDVSCAHKLSVTHVKEGDMFYPKLRGLSEDESRQLFLEGHFSDVWKGEENVDMMSMTLPLLLESTAHHA
jgi:Fe-S cluster assembly scaffold protein SufB